MTKRGDWIQTFTGRQFWPIDPMPDEVFIEDIAHALSMLCRFGGHSLRFYSVAEHSVLLCRAVTQENKLWALLHDASEAYLVDVPRPLKPFLRGYREAEDKIMRAVCTRFGLAPDMPPEVKAADTAILSTEADALMAKPPVEWSTRTVGLPVTIRGLSPPEAEAEFMAEFMAILSGRAALAEAEKEA